MSLWFYGTYNELVTGYLYLSHDIGNIVGIMGYKFSDDIYIYLIIFPMVGEVGAYNSNNYGLW